LLNVLLPLDGQRFLPLLVQRDRLRGVQEGHVDLGDTELDGLVDPFLLERERVLRAEGRTAMTSVGLESKKCLPREELGGSLVPRKRLHGCGSWVWAEDAWRHER